ncbi:unnamed protein product [Linum trigynum]|uniref:30S ribosomal protein S21, chloroplastic n=1 Tax=Linum trigynum TaxID=586398 RepID=A0AAV2CPJ6_9ROSI
MAAPLALSNFLSFLSPPSSISPPPHVSFFPSTYSSPSSLVAAPRRFPGGEFSSAASPSTVCLNSSYNVQIVVEENEPEERLLNRFRREVMRAGVIQECRRRRYFENKQDEKKRRVRDAAKRNRKRRPFSRFSNQSTAPPGSENKKNDDDGDNWEVPAGPIPY